MAPNGHIVSPLLGRAARDVPALQAAGKGRGQEGAHPHPAAGAQRWGYAAAPLPFSAMAAPGRSPRTSASQGINKISSSSGTEISLFAAAELQPDAQGAALIQTSHSNPSSGRLLQALAKRSRYGSIPACARSPTPAPAGSGDSAEERLSANEDNALPATHTPSTARHGTALVALLGVGMQPGTPTSQSCGAAAPRTPGCRVATTQVCCRVRDPRVPRCDPAAPRPVHPLCPWCAAMLQVWGVPLTAVPLRAALTEGEG